MKRGDISHRPDLEDEDEICGAVTAPTGGKLGASFLHIFSCTSWGPLGAGGRFRRPVLTATLSCYLPGGLHPERALPVGRTGASCLQELNGVAQYTLLSSV